ncbi:MAG: DUF2878 domain-containing protein [Phycisphaerae bacterium]|nr:DUF2878 domain-containing protein [Phycisphaerae bacterium]
MTALILNILALQFGWVACVVGAARGMPWLGPVVVAIFLVVHVALRKRRIPLLLFTILGALGGYSVDCALTAAGLLDFPLSPNARNLCPLWMFALWVNFVTSITGSLAFTQTRPVAAAAIGFIGGPMAYFGAERLGAVSLTHPRWLALIWIAGEWTLAVPLLAAICRRVLPPPEFGPQTNSQTADIAPPPPTGAST